LSTVLVSWSLLVSAVSWNLSAASLLVSWNLSAARVLVSWQKTVEDVVKKIDEN
jgi:hypothetical protein